MNVFAQKLNVMKNCGSGKGCLHEYYFLNGNKVDSSGTGIENQFDGRFGKIMLADGSSMLLRSYENNCTEDKGTGVLDNKVCGTITVDINGPKKPNTTGRDIFDFHIAKTGYLSLRNKR